MISASPLVQLDGSGAAMGDVCLEGPKRVFSVLDVVLEDFDRPSVEKLFIEDVDVPSVEKL